MVSLRSLNTLTAGDVIKIEMGDGKVYTYRVYDNFEVKLPEADKKMPSMMAHPLLMAKNQSQLSHVLASIV